MSHALNPKHSTFRVEAIHLIKLSLNNYSFLPIPSSAALLAAEIFTFWGWEQGEMGLELLGALRS